MIDHQANPSLVGEPKARRPTGTPAEVSSQTVRQQFESKEGLFIAAIEELGQEILRRRTGTAAGDVGAVAREPVAEYERYGDVNWSMFLLERESEAVAAALRIGRAGHRGWLETRFGPSLPPDPRRRREGA